jgi:hypothetical protein
MSVMPIFISVCAQREYVFFIATQSHFVMRDLFHKRMSVTPSPPLVCGNMIVSHATKQCTPKNVHCVPPPYVSSGDFLDGCDDPGRQDECLHVVERESI